jgi:hypothetical protein
MVIIAFTAIDIATVRALFARDLSYGYVVLLSAVPLASLLAGALVTALPRAGERPAFWWFASRSFALLAIFLATLFAAPLPTVRLQDGRLMVYSYALSNFARGPDGQDDSVFTVATSILAVILLIVLQIALMAVPRERWTAAAPRMRLIWMLALVAFALANFAVIDRLSSMSEGASSAPTLGNVTLFTLVVLAFMLTRFQAGFQRSGSRRIGDVAASFVVFGVMFWSWPSALQWYATTVANPIFLECATSPRSGFFGQIFQRFNGVWNGVPEFGFSIAGMALIILSQVVVPILAVRRGTRPSHSQTIGVLVLVVVAALDFGSVANVAQRSMLVDSSPSEKCRYLMLTLGTLPIANLLAFIFLFGLIRGGPSLALWRYVRDGVVASALFTMLVWVWPPVFTTYYELCLEPVARCIFVAPPRNWFEYLASAIVPVSMLMLPQVVLALMIWPVRLIRWSQPKVLAILFS